jgi:hypothetical protein
MKEVPRRLRNTSQEGLHGLHDDPVVGAVQALGCVSKYSEDGYIDGMEELESTD